MEDQLNRINDNIERLAAAADTIAMALESQVQMLERIADSNQPDVMTETAQIPGFENPLAGFPSIRGDK